MPYHEWGDEDFDWNSLYEAQSYIFDYVYKYSRCRVITKEKYGTIRYEYIFPPYGTLFYRSKLQRLWCRSFLYRLWIKLGKKVLESAVYSACEKYPTVKAEILADFEPEYWMC